MAEPTLIETMATFIEKHGRCVVVSHPDDRGAIKCDALAQSVIQELIAAGVVDVIENHFVAPGTVTVVAPASLAPFHWNPTF